MAAIDGAEWTGDDSNLWRGAAFPARPDEGPRMSYPRHGARPGSLAQRGARAIATALAVAVVSVLAAAGSTGPDGSRPTVGAPVAVLGDVATRLDPIPAPGDAPVAPIASAVLDHVDPPLASPAIVAPAPPPPPPPLPPPPPAPEVVLGPAAAEFVDRINALRASVGVAPLAVDRELTEQALRWANTMGARGDVWHQVDLSVGLTADWYRLGENVGYGPVVGPIQDAFVASPTHYANLVDPGFQTVGVGVVSIGGRLYVAQEFMQL